MLHNFNQCQKKEHIFATGLPTKLVEENLKEDLMSLENVSNSDLKHAWLVKNLYAHTTKWLSLIAVCINKLCYYALIWQNFVETAFGFLGFFNPRCAGLSGR